MAEDRPTRRTWWLLLGAFLLLGLITAVRALTSGDSLDWLPVVGVVIAAVAAILHRNAVANLEVRGREEAENFARILQGLSRSVSVDAIVGAIIDDLADGTGADHVVIVRRRPEGDALEATLVTRRPGVPSSSTVLPLTDLDAPLDRERPAAIAMPIDVPGAPPERELAAAGVRSGRPRAPGGRRTGAAGAAGARPGPAREGGGRDAGHRDRRPGRAARDGLARPASWTTSVWAIRSAQPASSSRRARRSSARARGPR